MARGISDAVEVVAGGQFTCARRAGGAVRCWGKNSSGQLGDGTLKDRRQPVAVKGLTDAVQLIAGHEHVCARRAGGAVVCWGKNSSGQLGDGSQPGSTVPLPPGCSRMGSQVCCRAPAGSRFHVNCAPYKTYADRHYWAFVRRSRSPVPVPVVGLSDAAFIAAGDRFTCALRRGGRVDCWGDNAYNQLSADKPRHRTPLRQPGLSPASAIAAHRATVCARRTTGSVVCKGPDQHSAAIRKPLSGKTGTLVMMGGRICVLAPGSGDLACTGNGLAIGPATTLHTGVAAVASGPRHECVERRDGSVLCQGDNESGQLGGPTPRGRGKVEVQGL
jgi:alpha-tubulin suppressor-like RCC1 family protein